LDKSCGHNVARLREYSPYFSLRRMVFSFVFTEWELWSWMELDLMHYRWIGYSEIDRASSRSGISLFNGRLAHGGVYFRGVAGR